MTKQLFYALLAIIMFCYPVQAQKHKDLSPDKVVTQFYTLLDELKISGLPGEDEFKKIAPYLSGSLQKVLLTAKQKQTTYIKKHPTHKPPWIEGDLFSSADEGISTHKIGVPIVHGAQARVPIQFTYQENEVTSKWTDTILLRRINKGWIVTNIVYETEKEFKPANSLRNILLSKY